jgi:methionyl-tRNA formyltransferase
MTSKKSTNSKSSIVFFGTGQTSLEALQCLSEDFVVELVVTKPPATNSAGKEFKNNVQVWAEQNDIKVINPKDKTELIKLAKQAKFQSELGIVLDFGMIIPSEVIDLFPMGILNSHFSLLPKYRGADPIRTAILNGDKTSGVTIIRITPGLDDGPILTWAELDIANMDAIELRGELSGLNCALLPETARMYLNNELEPIEQDESEVTHTHKAVKEDGRIDTNKASETLANEILAYVGWPKSYINIAGKETIILEAKPSQHKIPKGILEVNDKKLYLGCSGGSLEIIKLQPQGKAPMDAQGFINGYLK